MSQSMSTKGTSQIMGAPFGINTAPRNGSIYGFDS